MEKIKSEFHIRTLMELSAMSLAKKQLNSNKKQEELASAPEDASLPPASTCGKLEESEQLRTAMDVICSKLDLMSAQAQIRGAGKADTKEDIMVKLQMIKATLKEMKMMILDVFPGKQSKITVAQQKQISGKQTAHVEAETGSSSDTSTASSEESTSINDSQNSDTLQQQTSPKTKSPQENGQQMEDSRNGDVSCNGTSQQVETATTKSPEDLEAPKNTTEGSEAH
jgi:hypothetical protein